MWQNVSMGEPDRVTIQYILVSFSLTGEAEEPRSRRNRSDAEARARTAFDRARAGEDFDALVREFTDDRRRPPAAVYRRIEELYCRARKLESVERMYEGPDSSRCRADLYNLTRQIESILQDGKDFDAIRARLEDRKAHTIIRPEVKERMNRLHHGLGDRMDALFPEALTEVIWLTRDRAVFDQLLRDFDRTEPNDKFTLLNHGVSKTAPDQIPRAQAMRAWAYVAFALGPGELGFVPPENSSDFAILKRIL